ncbi:MAG TPA: L-ribulose-5-phosphate 4-epimerase AraD [Candidatus Acidoferrales bacterium]|jgi:L-ribulose-5-phosphate 4-epimerase|nr:L-ribulose-5-phosphate 4-epimerase AraD [Candidatus Acidoferrales bacterium]
MKLQRLREQVLEANLELVRRGLILYTFGNASGISRADGLVVIKPSGVPYDELKPEHMVITDLEGKIVEGDLRPSSDLPTHIVIYKAFANTGGVAHTHSEFAVSWAQAGRPIPCLGTTHADTFHGTVPVTADLTPEETETAYEKNTGDAIVRVFAHVNPDSVPGVLVKSHGPFTWGADPGTAAHNSAILEAVARMAYYSTSINPAVEPISPWLHDKHFLRKHGGARYYGQPVKK